MISFNLHQCNILFNQIFRDSSVGLAAYNTYIENLNLFKLECNHCHSCGECVKYGRYQRGYILTPEDLKGRGTQIRIQRVRCKHCKSTHALLPEEIVPYRQYSSIFIFLILFLLFLGEISINVICKTYDISIRQLKRWKKEYTKQKEQYLGVTASKQLNDKDVVSWFRERQDYGEDFAKPFFDEIEKMPAQTHANPTNMQRPIFM